MLGILNAILIVILFMGCSRSSENVATRTDLNADAGTETDICTDDACLAPTDSDTGAETDSDTGGSDCLIVATPNAETVITRYGAVRGALADGVTAFKGIPYAAPPLGDLRFQPPLPPPCLDATLNAGSFGPVCPQLEGGDGSFIGDEDCLTLNVWTLAALPAKGDVLPVLFFIHGGGNGLGSASESTAGSDIYDGAALALGGNAVVVTMEYRVGALGWIVNPTAAADGKPSGNFGLLDQIAALSWVRDNISGFGGDPNRVLVFGESAGALDTCMLLVSSAAAGLFHAAVMESGGCPGYSVDQVLDTTQTLIENAGCGDDAAPLDCLRGLSAEAIIEANPPLIDVAGLSEQTNYQPHVDGEVIPDKPMKLLEDGAYNHVPFIVGANSDETSRSVPSGLTEAQYAAVVTAMFGVLAGQVLDVYPADACDSPADAYIRLSTDAKFVCPSRIIAAYTANAQSEQVYRYFFTQAGGGAATGRFGAFHGLELLFVFGHLNIAGYTPTADQEALSLAMMRYWETLAADGDIEGAGAPTWDTYDPQIDNTLVLEGGAVEMQNEVRGAECDFWENLAALASI